MRLERAIYWAILAGYVVAGGLFAVVTPPWQAPDEPAHYNYVRQVAEEGCCPRVEMGDWDSAALALMTSAKFAPQTLEHLDAIQYEDHHPPLYYLLASVIYKLGGGDLILLRLFSVVLGAIPVALTFFICMRALDGQGHVALGAMALVAFIPQRLAMMSAVNNDALAEAIVAVALLWMARYVCGERVAIWQMGLIVGAALLCKATIYFLALLVPLAIFLKWREDRQGPLELVRMLGVFVVIAVAIGGGWWLRNVGVYGWPDFLGLAAHDAVVADQPRSADYMAEHGVWQTLSQGVIVSFKSFWGQFGWMALPLDGVLGGWVYRGFAVLTLAGLSGGLGRALSGSQGPGLDRAVVMLFGAATVLVLGAFVYYNLEFLQWQGRYLFPALIPIALGLAMGLDYWRGVLLGGWEWSRWLGPGGMLCLLPLNLFLLFRVIGPGLSP